MPPTIQPLEPIETSTPPRRSKPCPIDAAVVDAAQTLMNFARLQGHMNNHPGSMDCKICKAVGVVMENMEDKPCQD
jgi:hypothetical protein